MIETANELDASLKNLPSRLQLINHPDLAAHAIIEKMMTADFLKTDMIKERLGRSEEKRRFTFQICFNVTSWRITIATKEGGT